MPTITKENTFTEVEEILGQPYILLLWNDNYNTFDWVIECLIKICGHEYEQASQCAHLVHFTGKCDVKRGNQEIIVKLYNKLKGAGLTVTIEES